MGGFYNGSSREFYGSSGELMYMKDYQVDSTKYIYPLFQLLPFATGYDNYVLKRNEIGTRTYSYSDQAYGYKTYDYSIYDEAGNIATEDVVGRALLDINSETGAIDKVLHEPVWSTTDSNHASLPEYFEFGQATQDNIDKVSSELDSIFNTIADLDLSAYSSELVELKNIEMYDQLK